jgi:2-dehydro-3-deoxyphosphogalactonate aldolase
MTLIEHFNQAFETCPLIAILRGVLPDEVEEIGITLVKAGFKLIEVPLNSPNPLESIAKLAKTLHGKALVGAGTVLDIDSVQQVAEGGGQLIISPNFNPDVVKATRLHQLISLPGIFTPSEAFSALAAGAHLLKLFPAEATSPDALKAFRAVLPKEVRILPVGGITPQNLAIWRKAGASGFGLGSALYKAGRSPEETFIQAKAFLENWE